MTVLATWWYLYSFYFSPRACVKRLWKEVFKLTYDLAEIRKKLQTDMHQFNISYGKAIYKRKVLINAILDNYFDSEEDAEFIREHRADVEKFLKGDF